jgi:dCTP diphosphatase
LSVSDSSAAGGSSRESRPEPAGSAWSPEALGDDRSVTVGQLRDMVARFVAERNWRQFHAPKNLAMALSIEAAELMEHFQWLSVESSRQAADDPGRREAIGEELADVVCYALALANELELDLATVLVDKMKKNVRKYPASEFHGRYEKP